MKRVFVVPLLLEVVNRCIHALSRDDSIPERLQRADIIEIGVTVAIFVTLGWLVAATYSDKRFLKAAGLGLLLWFISTVVITGGENLASSSLSAPLTDSLVGPLLAFALFAPVAAVVPLSGVLLRRVLWPR